MVPGMGDTAIDLDILVPADKRVTFGQRVFTLPGDLPLVTYLQVNAMASAEESGEGEVELMNTMVGSLVNLFLWNVPEAEAGEMREWLDARIRRLGINTITNMLSEIYPFGDSNADDNGVIDADAAAAADPPKPVATPDGDGPTTTTSS